MKQNYLLSEHKFKGWNFYMLECVNEQQSYLVTIKDMNSIVQAKRVLILSQLYQNGSILIDKGQIFKQIQSKILSSQTKKTKTRAKIMKFLQRKEQQDKTIYNINNFFIKSNLGLITPKLWSRCYRLVNQVQLLQIVGRRAKKDFKKYDYLIKFKYFTQPQTFLCVRSINFNHHPCLKVLKDFDDKNPIEQEFIIDERYKIYQKQLKKRLISNPKKRYQVLGKSKIGVQMYFLFKDQQQDLCQAQWYMHYVIFISLKDEHRMNEKIRQSQHNLKNQPFIDRQKIKQILISQMGYSSKPKTNQLVIHSDLEMIEDMVDEKVKLFIQKFSKLKDEIHYFYTQSVQIDDSQENRSKILFSDKSKNCQKKILHRQQNLAENSQLKMQINKKILTNQKSTQKSLQNLNEVNLKQQNTSNFLKKQASPDKSVQTQQSSNGQISQSSSEQISQSSSGQICQNKIENKLEEFYKKVKQEFKRQLVQNYLKYEDFDQKRSKAMDPKRQEIKKQYEQQVKCENYSQKNVKIQNYEPETKRQDEQTTVEQSNAE